ncbi:MAG: alpha/beta fold hydrolase [Acidobacteriota bacterium]
MREFSVEGEGARSFAHEEGHGPVIVMLHGGMANHLAALPFIAPLAERYRIIAPDLRGSGRSWYGRPLTFDQLADGIELLLDHIGVSQAVVGGVSSGSGVALRFALRHPGRTLGLVLVKPIYAGEARGYTEHQKATFAMMHAVASRALEEGVQVLKPLYANLPAGMRERALAMAEGFDPASVVATSHFVTSGAQPFIAAEDLASLEPPTLVVRGDDPMHPAEVSDLYVAHIRKCTTVPASTTDIAGTIGPFVEECLRTAAVPRGQGRRITDVPSTFGADISYRLS